jgi:hypothetical protein
VPIVPTAFVGPDGPPFVRFAGLVTVSARDGKDLEPGGNR